MKTRPRNRATAESAALGKRLLTALDKAGKSQSDLARDLDVNRQTIQQLAAGFNSDPGARRLFRIADALAVNARWLALGEGAMRGEELLSPIESELLHLVRQLPKERQSEVTGFCKGLVGAQAANRTSAANALESFVTGLEPDDAKKLSDFLAIIAKAHAQ
ncbi:MAG: helix-turn-helix domain-containing protein [Usitatibacter sp.]